MVLAGDDDPTGNPSGTGHPGMTGHPSELPVLRGLTPPQRAAVTARGGPVCVVAGAGSGKTRVLTRRVAHRVLIGDARAEHTMVVTFTRKAASELRRRLWQLGVEGATTGTFHGLAFAELRRHWADRGQPAPAVLTDPVPMLRRLLAAGGTTRARQRAVDGDLLRAVAAEVDWAQARALAPGAYPAAARQADRRPPLDADQVADLLDRYRQEKRRRRVVDLHDLVTGATELLHTDRVTADAVRWRVRHVLVDEFQDVTAAQWHFLTAVLGNRPDLFVVGDPNQAIYSWNGSDPTLMLRLPELLPGTTVLSLGDNHRCTPQVVAAATAVLGTGPHRPVMTATPAPAGRPTGLPTPQRDQFGSTPGSARPDGPFPAVHGFDDDGAEAAAVVRWLRLVHPPGGRWSNLAVLARSHARLAATAAALARAGIPHRLGERARTTLASPMPTTNDAEPDDEAVPPGGSDGGTPTPGPGAGADRAAPGQDVPDHEDDAVALLTFHQAKGLEWDAVAVVGLETGTVPVAYARSPEAEAEERRLLYVALTRASRHLWCSWGAQRVATPRHRPAQASPWLAAVARAAQPPPQSPPPVARQHLRLLRQQLESTA